MGEAASWGPIYTLPLSSSPFLTIPSCSWQRKEALEGSQWLRRKAAWVQSWSFHSFLSLPALPISPSNHLRSWSIRSLLLSLSPSLCLLPLRVPHPRGSSRSFRKEGVSSFEDGANFLRELDQL